MKRVSKLCTAIQPLFTLHVVSVSPKSQMTSKMGGGGGGGGKTIVIPYNKTVQYEYKTGMVNSQHMRPQHTQTPWAWQGMSNK